MSDAATVAAHETSASLLRPHASRERAETLAEWQRDSLRTAARLVEPRNLHVTLAFLGHRPAGDVGPVSEALEAAAGSLAGPIRLSP